MATFCRRNGLFQQCAKPSNPHFDPSYLHQEGFRRLARPSHYHHVVENGHLVTALQSRTFAVWTFLAAIVRFYCAYHIHEKTSVSYSPRKHGALMSSRTEFTTSLCGATSLPLPISVLNGSCSAPLTLAQGCWALFLSHVRVCSLSILPSY